MTDVAIVGNRIDAVTLAYRLELDPDFVRFLEERAHEARKHGRASIAWGPIAGEMRHSRTAKTWQVTNPLMRLRFDQYAPGKVEHEDGTSEPGWTVEAVWTAEALASRDLDSVIRATRRIVRECAVAGVVAESRVRRLDLCADVAGWAISPIDAVRLVRRPRSKMAEHGREPVPSGDAGDEATTATVHSRREVTGVTVCPGGDVLLRLYDKPEELKAQSEEKRAAEEARWRARGWNGEAPITRVEYQIRGAAPKELGIRDPERPFDPRTGEKFRTLGAVVDRLWAWCLSWCKLCKLDHDRPSRRSLDPVWMALHGVKFVRELEPGELHGRVRVRGGASHEQALGCALSILAARGKLEARRERPGLEGDEARAALGADMAQIFGEVGREVTTHLADKWGPAMGLEHAAIVANATRDRFRVAAATLRALALSEMRPVGGTPGARAAPRVPEQMAFAVA